MTRQPFSPNYEELQKQYAIGLRSLQYHPELAASIGRCIATWSQVDNEIGVLFGNFLGTNSEAAMAVFSILRRSSSQIEALKEASKLCLSEDEITFFDKIIKKYKALEKERNFLAHACYGVAVNRDDILLCIPIKDHIQFQTKAVIRHLKNETVSDHHKELKENMFVYTKKDLIFLEKEMLDFCECILNFNIYLRDDDDSRKAGNLERVKNYLRIDS